MPYVFNPFTGNLDNTVPLSGGKVPAEYLPSYVDDVEEYANLAAFPATGETSKIYLALDTSKIYRWSGSIYVIVGSNVEALEDLTNVDPDAEYGVVDGRSLVYANGKWQAGPIIGGVNYTPSGGEIYYNNTPFLLDFAGSTLTEAGTNKGTSAIDFEPVTTTNLAITTGPFTGTQAIQFSNGRYRTPIGTSLTLGSTHTIEFWAYPTSSSGEIYNASNNAGTDLSWFIRLVGGTYNLWEGGLSRKSGAINISLNQWHHFALSTSSGTARIFINGVQDGGTFSFSWGSNTRHCFGGRFNNTTSAYQGRLAQARITNGIARYSSNFSVPTEPFPQSSSEPVSIPERYTASDVTGITGASRITNIVQLSQASYDAIVTPDPNTLYVIV